MFKYRQGGLDGAAADYNAVTMEPAQEALVRDLAALVGPRIGMDTFPCRGFWRQAVRKWQLAAQTTVDTAASLTPPERARAARAVGDHFAEIVKAHLRDPGQQAELDRAIDDAFEMYLSKYNQR